MAEAEDEEESEYEDEDDALVDMSEGDQELAEALSKLNFEDEAELKAFGERLLSGFGTSSSYLTPEALEAKLKAAYDLEADDPLYGDPDNPELKEVQLALEAGLQEVEDEMEEGEDEVRAWLKSVLDAKKEKEFAAMADLGVNLQEDGEVGADDEGGESAADGLDIEFDGEAGEGGQDEVEVNWGEELSGIDPDKQYGEEDAQELLDSLRKRYEYLVQEAQLAAEAEGPMYGQVFLNEEGKLVGEQGEPLQTAEELLRAQAEAESAEGGEAVGAAGSAAS